MKKETDPKEKQEAVTFSGIARSVQAFNNQGFKNFRILTLYLRDGKVQKIDKSDPYASFEALIKMELKNQDAIIHLNNNWADGRTLEK